MDWLYDSPKWAAVLWFVLMVAAVSALPLLSSVT